MSLEAIKYSNNQLRILDQLLLPFNSVNIPINNTEDAWRAIKTMQVRGAPAIAIVAGLSIAVELHSPSLNEKVQYKDDLKKWVDEKLEYLISARPTAVNVVSLAIRIRQLISPLVADNTVELKQMKSRIINELEEMFNEDVRDNKAIGDFGATDIKEKCVKRPLRILTHCNTGSLATASYGTALGVIRSLMASGDLDHAFCTETRPYNQGSRLTAYELVHDKIPATLICDSMACWAMEKKNISAVVVGADRVAANGDTANKIGTYQLAVLARHHSVPFYVAAPFTTIDFQTATGDDIVIEERAATEVTHIQGHRVAAEGIQCWNPAFDVTPAALITGGIITEKGVFTPAQLKQFQKI